MANVDQRKRGYQQLMDLPFMNNATKNDVAVQPEIRTPNITVNPTKNIAPSNDIQDITTRASKQIIENKKAPKAENVARETIPQGIDFGAIGKGGLDLLGQGANALSKVPTSDLMGITAGTEAGSRDADTYLAGAYGQKAGELQDKELREKEAEANRNLEAQKIFATMTGKQAEIEAEAKKAEAEALAKKKEEETKAAEARRQDILEGLKLSESKGEVPSGTYAEMAKKSLEELETLKIKPRSSWNKATLGLLGGSAGKATTDNAQPSKYKIVEEK